MLSPRKWSSAAAGRRSRCKIPFSNAAARNISRSLPWLISPNKMQYACEKQVPETASPCLLCLTSQPPLALGSCQHHGLRQKNRLRNRLALGLEFYPSLLSSTVGSIEREHLSHCLPYSLIGIRLLTVEPQEETKRLQ